VVFHPQTHPDFMSRGDSSNSKQKWVTHDEKLCRDDDVSSSTLTHSFSYLIHSPCNLTFPFISFHGGEEVWLSAIPSTSAVDVKVLCISRKQTFLNFDCFLIVCLEGAGEKCLDLMPSSFSWCVVVAPQPTQVQSLAV
jgi:hypothetical protein